ncbi:MAG: hypothetical protein QT08_C0010G0035 [archaeon GW2011_AR17]|nr:MAG: hypothetical protein QT08_C0010G0035 [archaeon GW2011_AR17]MBS3154321.1 hypothetical protein [Candidatus Woesearchaeota archaeon]HIH15259.1 hypothetical protein [Nanoarchaeota archaeon]HIH58586.1 hypothetical protein [Nanoarchaeota archaeon]HII13781.1 hypothetical protein [Nanoarchaeota archaeon]
MNFIRKIVDGKRDEWVQRQFTRYGKGLYEQKAVVQIIKGKKLSSISTGFEFSGEFAYQLAETIQGKTHVTGGVITTQKLTESEAGVPFSGMKQFAGVKTFLIDAELTKKQVQDLLTKFTSALVLLSFKTDEGELKTKVKNPKSAKATNKESEELPKADFCKFKTKDMSIVEDFAFDVPKGFTKVLIAHSFDITDLEIPKEYEKDFVTARLHAIRRGKLIREIHLDGKKLVKEYKL